RGCLAFRTLARRGPPRLRQRGDPSRRRRPPAPTRPGYGSARTPRPPARDRGRRSRALRHRRRGGSPWPPRSLVRHRSPMPSIPRIVRSCDLHLGVADRDAFGVLILRPHLELKPPHGTRSEEHTSELQSLAYLSCRLLLET